jgi:flagellin-like protein
LQTEKVKSLTRKMLKSRKAISPILATLLLIVIAVAAIVVTYAWIMTYMSGLGQQADVRLNEENVRFYGAPADAKNRTDFTVQNSGKSNTQIRTIYIGNTSGNLIDVTNYSNIGTGISLDGQSATTITVTWPNLLADSWEIGKTYYFKIVPAQGQYLEISVPATV